MKVLLTGAFGNAGLSTLEELIKRGHDVRVLELPTPRNRKLAKRYRDTASIVWGDLRNAEDVQAAVAGREIVLHLAAIIPPLADRKPQFAEAVNVGGTRNLVEAMQKQPQSPRLLFTSSVAVYGDRLDSPWLEPSDPPNPNADDEYAKQKLQCEQIIRDSGLRWAIFRLTFVVSPTKLQMDPLMFDMPLETPLEICHTKDVGLALANAAERNDLWGQVMHLAGGEKCRIIYRDFLGKMMEIFGLGGDFLPPKAFRTNGFHCGFMTTGNSRSLAYQRHSLQDYFDEVKRHVAIRRCLVKAAAPVVRPLIRRYLLSKSPYYRNHRTGQVPSGVELASGSTSDLNPAAD